MPRLLTGLLLSLGISIGATLGWSLETSAGDSSRPVIAITAIVEHPVLNAVRDGIRDELFDEGFRDGDTASVVFKTAQGQVATAVQIARDYAGMRPSVIVAISTLSAQTAAAATNDIPIVFGAVTDPVGAKLVASLEAPGGNVSGTTDLTPIAEELALVHQIQPSVSRIGLISNPGEANSVKLVQLVRASAAKLGMTVIVASAPRSADVPSAVESLVGKVDVFFAQGDNTVAEAFESLVGIANANKIPIYAADTQAVEHGAIAALGFNYYQLGRLTGKIVVEVLRGTPVGAIPVQSLKTTELFVNLQAAAQDDVTVPPEILSSAKHVIGSR